MADGGIPLGEWSGSTATRELRKTIEEFNEQSAKQGRTIIRLTWAILVLTGVMATEVSIQLWKIFWP